MPRVRKEREGDINRLVAHGSVPYGYKLVKRNKKRVLEPDPYTRAFGARFMEWRDAGWSYKEIVAHLEMNGRRTRLAKHWTEHGVREAERGERVLQAIMARREAEKLVAQMEEEEEREREGEVSGDDQRGGSGSKRSKDVGRLGHRKRGSGG